jgi:peptidoglycan/LPS O-acetylase OafA/YrhL
LDPAASRESFRDLNFFGSLDGLRALSIAGVVWFHSWWGTPYYPALARIPVLRQGTFGVDVFFVISGFLITTLLLREEDRYGRISLRNFYVRRALRIWPLYYATIGIYVVILLLFPGRGYSTPSFFHYLPYFLTYTYTWFITPQWPTGTFNLAWTLSTEEQFYAFWPIAVRVVKGWLRPAVLVALIALKVAQGRGWLNFVLPNGALPARIVASLSIPIFLGVLLALTLHSANGFRRAYAILGWRWTAPAALAALAACLAPQPIWWWPAWLASTALVGACVIREDNGLAPVLRLRPMALIGMASYGMYLLSSLVMHLVTVPLDKIGITFPPIAFPFTLAVTIAVALLSYRYFETPFLKLKSRFMQSRHAPQSDAQNDAGAAKRGVLVQPSES